MQRQKTYLAQEGAKYMASGEQWPTVPPAGVQSGQHVSAAFCVHPNLFEDRPSTPPHLKPFRRNTNPGEQCVNPAAYHDVKNGTKSDWVFGQKSVKGVSAESCMKTNRIGIEGWMQEQKEKVYRSTKNEPLERRKEYNYQFPPQITNNPDFRFGIRETSDEKDAAKHLAFPRDVLPNSEEAQQMYITSHSAYRPEEQIRRNYNWPVDPTRHAFGRPNTPTKDSVARCFDQVGVDSNKGGFPVTKIASKVNEDYRRVVHDEINVAKHRGQGAPPVPEGFAFGYRPPGDKFTSAEIIRGVYSQEECAPDADLNVNTKLVKEPRKLSAPAHILNGHWDERTGTWVEPRRLGVPSVRTDIQAPARKSVSDMNNYGNEPGAQHLLKPQRFASLGVRDEEFVRKRTRQEINDLVESALGSCVTTSSEERGGPSSLKLPCSFDEAYDMARRVEHFLDGRPADEPLDEEDDRVSLRAFLHATGHKVDERVAVEMGALSHTLALPVDGSRGAVAEYPLYTQGGSRRGNRTNQSSIVLG